jgi:glycosyltransferase involved in cell wall biosynthesis
MGDCLDTRSLRITNQPQWAEVDVQSLRSQMRRAFEDRQQSETLGARGHADVIRRFTWDQAAATLQHIAGDVRARCSGTRQSVEVPAAPPAERSPYWLGLRVSVVIPTRDRKDTLIECLNALARQSVLPQEFEVVVVDDGSADGTKEAVETGRFPFAVRCFRQESAGPGAARNLGIEQAAGELVLFIGDDIIADERLLEEHLLAHAAHPEPGAAFLGHIDWPPSIKSTAVMDYVCGDAMLQFAYSYIPTAAALDHRFFYTSNISMKRQFLKEAAADGIRFDPDFYHAAFEDSEFAFRLIPRGLEIRYAGNARATHDHWMDLESFAERELRAGRMAVVFYRKHPGQDDQLQVRWIADLVEPATALHAQPDVLHRLEAFDSQTDTQLRRLAAVLEELMAVDRQPRPGSPPAGISVERRRTALNGVLRVIFDVQRTRGKLEEWFSTVADPEQVRPAKILASVMRKIDFLEVSQVQFGTLGTNVEAIDPHMIAELRGHIAQLPGFPMTRPAAYSEQGPRRTLNRFIATPAVLSRLVTVDRFIEARLQSTFGRSWVAGYRRMRSRIRSILT